MPEPDPDEREPGRSSPQPSDREVERRWAELTAQLGDLGTQENAKDDHEPVAGADETGAAPSGPRDYEVAEDGEETGFVPPDPPPLRGSDPLPTLAWLAALGGPVATVIFLIVWPSAPSWVYLAAIMGSVVGWLVLLWRMPRSRDDSDDGAVV
ncbi:hypothetical protein IM660_10440 [Ruania alkalisoli]|uniref:DUF308 domain-containing protein n=1 Tax=Ruania alkalisoli TaxID=2779775 RepID=A0A7M1SNL3_9MICO|nr:hypothetical protein [Ruania alkalisoli]QOR69149.1 hypothetical protein IM660_10440 [Ruania alkalisoli]